MTSQRILERERGRRNLHAITAVLALGAGGGTVAAAAAAHAATVRHAATPATVPQSSPTTPGTDQPGNPSLTDGLQYPDYANDQNPAADGADQGPDPVLPPQVTDQGQAPAAVSSGS
jgi:hypothetical protein